MTSLMKGTTSGNLVVPSCICRNKEQSVLREEGFLIPFFLQLYYNTG